MSEILWALSRSFRSVRVQWDQLFRSVWLCFFHFGNRSGCVSCDRSHRQEKLSRYGGTCRSHLLFSPTVILGVTEANAKLIFSEKDLAWPRHFQQLVGTSSLPMVNDPLHKKIRTLNSRAFGDRQLDSYLPCLQRLSAKHLDAWAETGGISTSQDLHLVVKKYAFECGEAVILGVENDPLTTNSLMQLYENTFKGLGYVVPLDIPGFPFHECMKARKLLVQEFETLIEKKRQKLKDPCRMFQINTMLDTMLRLPFFFSVVFFFFSQPSQPFIVKRKQQKIQGRPKA